MSPLPGAGGVPYSPSVEGVVSARRSTSKENGRSFVISAPESVEEKDCWHAIVATERVPTRRQHRHKAKGRADEAWRFWLPFNEARARSEVETDHDRATAEASLSEIMSLGQADGATVGIPDPSPCHRVPFCLLQDYASRLLLYSSQDARRDSQALGLGRAGVVNRLRRDEI